MKVTYSWIFPILVIALLIRLPALDQSLWLDEAIQAQTTTFSFSYLFTHYLPTDFNPPLFYLVTWISTKLLGMSEVTLRLPSVLAGVGIVWLGYRFLSSFGTSKDTVSVIWGTLLLSTAPLLLYYSQEARAYELAAFFGFWSMLLFYEHFILEKHNGKVYWLVTGLMLLTHYQTVYLWLTQLVVLIVLSNKKQDFKKQIVHLFVPTLSFIFLLPLLSEQVAAGQHVMQELSVWQSLGSLSFKQLVLIPVKILVGRIPVDSTVFVGFLIGTPLLFWLVTVLHLFKVIRVNTVQNYFKEHALEFMLFAWLVLPVVIGMMVSLKVSSFTYFRFLYIVPAFYLLLVLGARKLSKLPQTLVLSLFLVINCVCSGLYVCNDAFHREDWKQLVEYIHSRQLSKNIVIIKAVEAPFWYYDHNQSNLVDYQAINTHSGESTVWLVKYAQPIFDPENTTEMRLTSTYNYTELEEKHFRGNLILKYLVNTQNTTAGI